MCGVLTGALALGRKAIPEQMQQKQTRATKLKAAPFSEPSDMALPIDARAKLKVHASAISKHETSA